MIRHQRWQSTTTVVTEESEVTDFREIPSWVFRGKDCNCCRFPLIDASTTIAADVQGFYVQLFHPKCWNKIQVTK